MKMTDIRLFGVEVAHIGKIFNGTEDSLTNLFRKNGYKYVAKSRFDKFFGKLPEIGLENSNGILHIY